jgi:hypothetical protein
MKSIGKLIYSPRSHLAVSGRWLVVMCDDEISKYYRSLFYMQYPWLGKLTRPVWGTHISVIRNERVPNNHLWKKDNGKIIKFEYEPGVISNGEYYWLKVKCPELKQIREKLGLKPYPKFGFHLTVGRVSATKI